MKKITLFGILAMVFAVPLSYGLSISPPEGEWQASFKPIWQSEVRVNNGYLSFQHVQGTPLANYTDAFEVVWSGTYASNLEIPLVSEFSGSITGLPSPMPLTFTADGTKGLKAVAKVKMNALPLVFAGKPSNFFDQLCASKSDGQWTGLLTIPVQAASFPINILHKGKVVNSAQAKLESMTSLVLRCMKPPTVNSTGTR